MKFHNSEISLQMGNLEKGLSIGIFFAIDYITGKSCTRFPIFQEHTIKIPTKLTRGDHYAVRNLRRTNVLAEKLYRLWPEWIEYRISGPLVTRFFGACQKMPNNAHHRLHKTIIPLRRSFRGRARVSKFPDAFDLCLLAAVGLLFLLRPKINAINSQWDITVCCCAGHVYQGDLIAIKNNTRCLKDKNMGHIMKKKRLVKNLKT